MRRTLAARLARLESASLDRIGVNADLWQRVWPLLTLTSCITAAALATESKGAGKRLMPFPKRDIQQENPRGVGKGRFVDPKPSVADDGFAEAGI